LYTAKVSLSVVLLRAIEKATEFAESRNVTFVSPVAGPDFILGDEDLLIRALRALLETAVRFSKKGETVRVSTDEGRDSPSILIESAGKAVPNSSLAKLFEIFAVSEAETLGGDLGLGPALAYRILSLFGGSVSVANRDAPGIRLTVSLVNASPQ
jgi:K+-sensing histidine kinase KdpD